MKRFKNVSLLLLLIPLNCYAIEKDFYLRADIGSTIPSDKSISRKNMYFYPKTKKLTNSFGYSVGLGYYLTKKIRTDITISKLGNFKSKDYKDINYIRERKINVNVVFLNVYYDLFKKNKFVPYVGFGLGVSKLSSGKLAYELSGHKILFTHDKDKASFAYKLTAGTSYEFNKHISLDANYNYGYYGKLQKFRNIYIDGTKFVNLDRRSKSKRFYAHSLMLGVRYKW